MKQRPIKMTAGSIGQHLAMWFSHDECEALARKTGFIQRSTSRLTGSDFFNLLTVETLNEPTISYEGLCDLLEDRQPNRQITPQALCERMNSNGAVEFLKASLEKTLKETAQSSPVTREAAWLNPFPRVLLQDSTQLQIHEKMPMRLKAAAATPAPQASKSITASTSNMKRPSISFSAKGLTAAPCLRKMCPAGFNRATW
jgi:hypothetical protein